MPLLKHSLDSFIARSSFRWTILSSGRPICHECNQSLTRSKFPPAASLVRPFSWSTQHQKKFSGSPKSSKKSPSTSSPDQNQHIPDNKHTRAIDSEPDPYDNSELQAAIDSTIARLRDALAKSRDAGRVSAEMIENLTVELNVKGSKAEGTSAHKQATTIADLASVVPKGGRQMQVFCAEEAHVKPLISAIQSSSYSLTPQANDPNNPLVILVPVPPATQETRNAAVAAAKKAMDKAALDVRNARGDAQKKFRKMELNKVVSPDELRKAHKKMEEVAQAGQTEVKKVHDAAVRALQNV